MSRQWRHARIFATRDKSQRSSHWDEWLKRFANGIGKSWVRSVYLAREVLEAIARLEVPNVTNISKQEWIQEGSKSSWCTGRAFCHTWPRPSVGSPGKPQYFFWLRPCDSSWAEILKNGNIFHEYINQNLFKGLKPKPLRFYRSKRLLYRVCRWGWGLSCILWICRSKQTATHDVSSRGQSKSREKSFVYCPTDAADDDRNRSEEGFWIRSCNCKYYSAPEVRNGTGFHESFASAITNGALFVGLLQLTVWSFTAWTHIGRQANLFVSPYADIKPNTSNAIAANLINFSVYFFIFAPYKNILAEWLSDPFRVTRQTQAMPRNDCLKWLDFVHTYSSRHCTRTTVIHAGMPSSHCHSPHIISKSSAS